MASFRLVFTDAIAVDGKSLRGSGHGARSRAAHLLSGFVHRTGQVIGPVDVKTHEIPKIRDLLDPLEIAGQIVTVDALHTQRHTASCLVEAKRAHDVMEVKANQATLEEALAAVSPEDFSPSGHDDRSGAWAR